MKPLIDSIPERHNPKPISHKVDKRIERDRLRRQQKLIEQNMLDNIGELEKIIARGVGSL